MLVSGDSSHREDRPEPVGPAPDSERRECFLSQTSTTISHRMPTSAGLPRHDNEALFAGAPYPTSSSRFRITF
jgi:hypothetical protein